MDDIATFVVDIRDGPGDYVITVQGEIDLYSSAPLREALRGALAIRPRRLIVDLADVTFIDSSGLGVIAGAYKRAETAGTGLVLQAPSAQVRRVLDLTDLTRVLTII